VHYDTQAQPLEEALAPFAYCPFCGTPQPRPGTFSLSCPHCRRRLFRNPDPGTVILVEREEQLLLGRRSAGYGRGMWGLPGGFIEYEEDFIVGARREVREESGLEVEIDAIVNVTSNLLRPALHILAIVLLAHPTGGSEQPGDDLAELAWFGREDTLPPLAFEADAHIIQVWQQRQLVRIPVHRP